MEDNDSRKALEIQREKWVSFFGQKYLKEYRHGTYTAMLLGGTLKAHCLMIQEQAEERFDLLVQKMVKREGVTEQLKRQEQMTWVQKMNNIRARAEEIVREEIIFV